MKYNDYGELMYVSRKDFQIKRSGYRIELGEIETATNSVEQVKGCVCVYDKELDCLAVIYEGRQDLIDEIRHRLGETLPAYMMPNDIIRIDSLPLNANGKIDRVKLAQNLKTLIKRS